MDFLLSLSHARRRRSVPESFLQQGKFILQLIYSLFNQRCSLIYNYCSESIPICSATKGAGLLQLAMFSHLVFSTSLSPYAILRFFSFVCLAKIK